MDDKKHSVIHSVIQSFILFILFLLSKSRKWAKPNRHQDDYSFVHSVIQSFFLFILAEMTKSQEWAKPNRHFMQMNE